MVENAVRTGYNLIKISCFDPLPLSKQLILIRLELDTRLNLYGQKKGWESVLTVAPWSKEKHCLELLIYS